MVSFLYRMPAGIPGQVTRLETATIEPQAYDPAVPFGAYGVAAKVGTNGKMQPVGAGDVATSIYGLLVRPYPTTGSATTAFSSTLGSAVPYVGGVCNILTRGFMMVLLSGTAPAVKDGAVYLRVAGAAAGKPIGGFEAVNDATAGNTILVPNAVFVGPADPQGNTELRFNI